MKQIDFNSCDYELKDELKTFVMTLNSTFDKFTTDRNNADAGLKKIEKDIENKNKSIEKHDNELLMLKKKEEELTELKEFTSNTIKELQNDKKDVDFTDSEVQKMELEDINTLITSKQSKIKKIETKINSTKGKIKENTEAKKICQSELNVLLEDKEKSEISLNRTNDILVLINETKETFNSEIENILNKKYDTYENKISKLAEEPPKLDGEIYDISKNNEFKENKSELKEEDLLDTQELSILNFNVNDATAEVSKNESKNAEIYNDEDDSEMGITDYSSLLEDIFNKEVINFASFPLNIKKKMIENGERVIKNLSVLKKHKIPLELTIKQSNIYYEIDPQDLDDLLNIITVDDEGNGMGFGIEYTYYILSELAKTNVDNLIEVYNNDFMNVNSKTGVIELIKKANPELSDFKNNKKANIDTLTTIGINTANEIAEKYPEFINLDNPLLIEALNLFDKDDLIEKLNADINIVPKILEYWKNN